MEASSGRAGGLRAGGGRETHGDPAAGLTERQGQGRRLAELTNLKNNNSDKFDKLVTPAVNRTPGSDARPLRELSSFHS